MTSANRSRVFLDVSIGATPAGRLTIELFTDKAPKAAEQFRQLCTGTPNGLSYAQSPFHRVIDEFMIQGGDITRGDGTGTSSIYDGEFEDENLNWREMDAAGLVCSATRGKDMNNSQFFISLEPCPHLNGKQTIFGRVVSGEETLQRISKVAVDNQDRPVEPVLVARCGELEKRSKKASTPQQHLVSQTGDDRGRRRKSVPSDEEMNVTPPTAARRNRRQSDHIVDEGIRGRPRLRSGSRSPVPEAIEEDDGKSSSRSPVKKHKRKRSSSPTRHIDRQPEKSGFERRRRSLPNQYNDGEARGADRYRPSARNSRSPRRDESRRVNDRRDDRQRYYKDRSGRLESDGRLGGSGNDDFDPPVKFKGRGVMKYREPDRAW